MLQSPRRVSFYLSELIFWGFIMIIILFDLGLLDIVNTQIGCY